MKLTHKTLLFAVMGLALNASAGVINDIPSCYKANKLANPTPVPESELFVAIDQTTPLDDNLKRQVMEIVGAQMKPGNAYSLFTFSAYNQGNYLTMLSRGELEKNLPVAVRDDTGTKVLGQFDACMAGQQRYAGQLLGKHLQQAMSNSSDNLARSDVLASLKEISNRITQSSAKTRILLLVSDMLENSSVSSFYANHAVRKLDPATELPKVEREKLLGNFGGARVYVIGAGMITEDKKRIKGVYRDPVTMQALESFWRGYFDKSGAKLAEFGKPALLGTVR